MFSKFVGTGTGIVGHTGFNQMLLVVIDRVSVLHYVNIKLFLPDQK